MIDFVFVKKDGFSPAYTDSNHVGIYVEFVDIVANTQDCPAKSHNWPSRNYNAYSSCVATPCVDLRWIGISHDYPQENRPTGTLLNVFHSRCARVH